MITREEYNKSLDIVEAYHKQIFFNKDNESKKTPLLEWDKLQDCSSRLKYAIKRLYWWEYELNKTSFIENLTWKQFARIPRAGKKTWDEFTKLRGY